MVLAQEVTLLDADIGDASVWSIRRGWESVFSASVVKTAGSTCSKSAGVAIFARDFLGLRWPCSTNEASAIVSPSRVVAAVVDAPGLSDLAVYSGYMQCLIGMTGPNLEIAAAVGKHVQEYGRSFVFAADFNCEPAALLASGFPARLSATIFCSGSDKPTLRTSSATKVYDFFMLSEAPGRIVESLVVEPSPLIPTHAPVRLVFKPNAAKVTFRTLRMPQRIPLEVPFGPRHEAPAWEEPIARLEALAAKVKDERCDHRYARGFVDKAYAIVANLAEKELALTTDTVLVKPGLRGQQPQIVERLAYQVLPKPLEFASVIASSWRWVVERSRVIRGVACGLARSSEEMDMPSPLDSASSHHDDALAAFHGIVEEMAWTEPEGTAECNALAVAWATLQREAAYVAKAVRDNLLGRRLRWRVARRL